jgi:hypothetical protein
MESICFDKRRGKILGKRNAFEHCAIMDSNPKMIAVVSAVIQWSTAAVAVGFPIWRIAKSGRFWSSFLLMWLYLILWAVLFTMIAPPVFACVFHDRRAWEYFPDGPAVTGMVCGGWLTCLILCALALGIRNVWIHFRSRSN